MSEQIINNFNKGMHSGIDPSVFPEGSYRTMRNGHIFSRNDRGFVVTNITKPSVAFSLTEGYVPIGSCEFNGKLYIMSYNGNSTPMVEFGVYTPGATSPYSPLATLSDAEGSGRPLRIDASLIGYSKDHLVSMFPRASYDGSVNLYICDGFNANIVVNTEREYIHTSVNPLEVSDFAQFKSLDSMPEIEAEVIDGGYMKPGNYFFAFRYTTKDYNSTIFFNQIGPYCISEDDRGTLDIEDITLPKSVKLTIEGMDADYRHVEIGVLRYFGETEVQSTEMYLVTKKFTTDGDVYIDGKEDKINLTPEELLKNNILVSTCKSHLQHNNRYFGANWTSDIKDLHDKLARAAGRIIPEYVIKTGDNDEQMITDAFSRNYADINSYKEMKYKAGECYPFAVSFVISGKYITDAYPICGYDSNEVDKGPVTEIGTVSHTVVNDVIHAQLGGKSYKGYELYIQNKGLYRFPFASTLVGSKYNTSEWRRRLYLGMMGVKFDTSLLENDLADVDVTAVLIMQGNRVENWESQGVCVPLMSQIMVHRPEIYNTPYDINIYTNQIISFGDGVTPVYFPWYHRAVANQLNEEEDVDIYRYHNFPVLTIRGTVAPENWHKPIMSYRQWGYASPFHKRNDFDSHDSYAGSDGWIVNPANKNIGIDFNNKERVYVFFGNPDPVYFDYTISNNSMVEVDKYAYMSPDKVNESNLFSGFIRSLYKIPGDDIPDILINCIGVSENKATGSITKPYGPTGYRSLHRGFEYVIRPSESHMDISAFINPFNSERIFSEGVIMRAVSDNSIVPDDNGCISRMKSVFEVFGPLNPDENGEDASYFSTHIKGRRRIDLTNAGIMLNRLMLRNEYQISEADIRAPGPDSDGVYQGWYIPLQDWSTLDLTTIQKEENKYLSLPVIITNMSLKSSSYRYFKSVADDIAYTYSDFINECYRHNPDTEDCYSLAKASFIINNERYYPISSIKPSDITTKALYKGDIFSQVVTFRLNRWSHEPLHNPEEEDYRHGQVAQVFLECTKNHNLRISDIDQTFFPYAQKMGFDIQDFAFKSNSERLTNESWSYNAGHMELHGLFSRYGIDLEDPIAATDKPNRVYWSSIYTDGSFEDAYRDIASSNYKDFNAENGAIQKIIKHSDRLFIIQERGISQLYEANTLEQSQDSSSIIIGDPGVLYPHTHELSTYGTQHPESIVTGANGVYGVDWMQKKIWSLQLKISDRGNYFHLVEDLMESKSLRTFFKDLEGNNYKPMNPLVNTLFAGTPLGIASGADQELGKIYFTFHTGTEIKTLVYDENQQVFIGYYDYTPNIYIPFRNKCLMFKAGSVNVLQPEGATTYNNTTEAEEALGPFVLEFYVNGISGQKNLSNLQKEYILHRIFGSDNLLKLDAYVKDIEWSTEYQDSKFGSIEDKDEFWRTPYFEDHVWNVPVSVAEQTGGNKGPEGTAVYETFEAGSTMRGEWLKVKLTYRGIEEIYIKNIVTDILNSFS